MLTSETSRLVPVDPVLPRPYPDTAGPGADQTRLDLTRLGQEGHNPVYSSPPSPKTGSRPEGLEQTALIEDRVVRDPYLRTETRTEL